MTQFNLNRTAIYKQIKERIIDQIKSGYYIPSQALPSEIQLAKEFNVSQGSVRQAIEELKRENIVYRIQGKGSFINDNIKIDGLFKYFKIHDLQEKKLIPQSELIDLHEKKPLKSEKENLRIVDDKTVFRLRRYRLLNKKKTLFQILSIPTELFPNFDSLTISNHVYSIYSKHYGKVVGKVQDKLFAVIDAGVSKKLNLPANTPLLKIERLTFDINERPIEYRRTWFETKHCCYYNSLV